MLQTVQTAAVPVAAESLAARAARAAEVAAAQAGAVDANSRFPQEAMDALKAEKLLGIMVPAALASSPPSAAGTMMPRSFSAFSASMASCGKRLFASTALGGE